jgi:hypothetical protein
MPVFRQHKPSDYNVWITTQLHSRKRAVYLIGHGNTGATIFSKWTMMPTCLCACRPCLQLLMAFCDLVKLLEYGTRCALPGVDDFVLVYNTCSQTKTFAYWGLHKTQLVTAQTATGQWMQGEMPQRGSWQYVCDLLAKRPI